VYQYRERKDKLFEMWIDWCFPYYMPKKRNRVEELEEDIIERIDLPSKPEPIVRIKGGIYDFTLQFLRDLKENNNREWFTINRKRYEASRENILEMIEYSLAELGRIDPHIASLDPKYCIFRINRDVRFSADKSTYKTHFGAHLCMGGKKSGNAGYYIHIQPGQSFVGGGIWQPPSSTIGTIRSHLAEDPSLLKEVLNMDVMVQVFGKKGLELLDPNNKLKTAPKGFAKDHPEIALLRFKSFTITKEFTDEEILSKEFPKLLIETLEAIVPFIIVLNEYKS
jgi:uncharacterized protein (TIGR02453 family)